MTCPKCGVPVEDPGLCAACWDSVRDVDGAIRKATRNREIVAKLAAGADVGDLAREYRISRRSVFRIREAAIRRLCDHVPFAARTGAVIIIGLLRGIVKPGVDYSQAMAWLR